MGRSTTPTYRVEFQIASPARIGWTPMRWDGKHLGRVSDANLAKMVKVYEDATKPGGVNAHLGETTIAAARVIRQATGDVVATFGTWEGR